jgi:hypothetical protein
LTLLNWKNGYLLLKVSHRSSKFFSGSRMLTPLVLTQERR